MSRALIILAWFLGCATLILSHGSFNVLALSSMLCVLVVGLRALRAPFSGLPSPRLAFGLVLASVVLWALGPLPLYLKSRYALSISISAALIVVLGCLPAIRGRWGATARLVAVAVCAAATLVIAADVPHIDVWFMLQQAAEGLVHGRDMYAQTWVDSPGIQHHFVYTPWSAVLLAPFRLVLGDVRYGLLAALIGVSILLWREAGPAARPFALLVLLAPGTLFLIEESWTEPLLLLEVVAVILAARHRRHSAAVAFLALAIATKQHAWILLPVMAAWRPMGVRRVATACLLGILLCLPWILAGPTAFYAGVAGFHIRVAPRPDSLSLSALAMALGGYIPLAATAAVTLCTAGWAAWRVHRGANVAWASSVSLLTFHLMNKTSFFNEYWLPLQLLIVGVIIASTEKPVVGVLADMPLPLQQPLKP